MNVELCDRAMKTATNYRSCCGYPSLQVIEGLIRRLRLPEDPGSPYDWRDVLDAALWDAGFAVEWRGEEIYEVMRRPLFPKARR